MAERLPTVAAGFRRGEERPASGTVGQGREVAYATGGGRLTAVATVELFADGTAAPAALEALLTETLGPALAREMREAGRFTVATGAPPSAPLFCARTAGRYRREQVAGLACAGRVAGGGALLRIRVAMPAREPPPADPRAFAEGIAAALSGAAPPRPPPPG